MTIPPTTREAILDALSEFDRAVRDQMGGWESNGNYEYALIHAGKRYPPKQIISMAAKVPTSTFSGGPQSNTYLEGYGFQVLPLHNGSRRAPDLSWAEFIHWARRLYERPDFQLQEVEYKLVVAQRVVEARRAVERDEPDWYSKLKMAFGSPNNLTPWQVHDGFLKWVAESPDSGRRCLLAGWNDSESPSDRVDAFLAALPPEIVKGPGGRLALASFLQAGVDVHAYPIYRPEPVRAAYGLVGYAAEGEGATGGAWYSHFLDFLDAVIAAGAAMGLAIPDRLNAQGIVWSIVHSVPPTEWSTADQRALIAYRGGHPYEGTGFREPIVEILAGYAEARRSAPFGGDNPIIAAFKRATQSLQASAAVKAHARVRVSYSAGQGNWARVPWIALMDDRLTRTTQSGVYCVYLFREDLSGVYLTLNQGVTEPKRQLGPAAGRKWLRDTVVRLRQTLGPALANAGFTVDDHIDLHTSSSLAADYESAAIAYKLYASSDVPDDAELSHDVELLLRAYEGIIVETEQPEVDLAVVVSQFSSALTTAHVDYGLRHDELVRTFLASLMTRPFVVLTGLSGSGKSQLGAKLGEWLGDAQRLFVAVRPDWTGPEALFGYVDILQERSQDGRRSWSVPPVLEFLLQASKDPSRPYLLVLDEMNLAHVERYLADFLSGLESGEPVLPSVVQEGGIWRDAADDANPLPIPRNLFVVGTVNVDETTYMFSPKVLDRANVLEFRVSTDDLADPRKPQALAPAAPASLAALLSVLTDDSWQEAHPSPDLDAFSAALRALHTRLSRHSAEFGFRTFYDARRFLAIFSGMGAGSWIQALDLQVLQKMLPRLHGARRRLEPVLLEVAAFCADPSIESALAATTVDPFDVDLQEPLLTHTWDKVKRMLSSARANQFASFME